MQVQQRQQVDTFGDLRHHGGKIAEENRFRLPSRLIDPLVVHPRRDHLHRPRTSDQLPRLGVPVTDRQPPALLVGVGVDAGGDLGLQRRRSIRRAPSRTILSSSDTDGLAAPSESPTTTSGTTVSMGVPSRPRRQRRPDRGPTHFRTSPGRCAHSRHPAGDVIHRSRSLLRCTPRVQTCNSRCFAGG